MRPQEKTLPARDMDKLSGTVLGVHIGVYQAQSITPFQKFER